MKNQIELLKKLKALSERGESGEQENAKDKLNLLLKKNGLTLNDLETEDIKRHFFRIKQTDCQLFLTIVFKVNHQIQPYGFLTEKYIKANKLKGNVHIDSTHSEAVEIMAMYEFYLRAYKQSLKAHYVAFVLKNNLEMTSENAGISIKDLSKEDLEVYENAQKMMDLIKKSNYHRQINK